MKADKKFFFKGPKTYQRQRNPTPNRKKELNPACLNHPRSAKGGCSHRRSANYKRNSAREERKTMCH
ncbi:hypothetical protein KIL84_000531, partial [Mauremys mutica]